LEIVRSAGIAGFRRGWELYPCSMAGLRIRDPSRGAGSRGVHLLPGAVTAGRSVYEPFRNNSNLRLVLLRVPEVSQYPPRARGAAQHQKATVDAGRRDRLHGLRWSPEVSVFYDYGTNSNSGRLSTCRATGTCGSVLPTAKSMGHRPGCGALHAGTDAANICPSFALPTAWSVVRTPFAILSPRIPLPSGERKSRFRALLSENASAWARLARAGSAPKPRPGWCP